jgi:hypothetical protein
MNRELAVAKVGRWTAEPIATTLVSITRIVIAVVFIVVRLNGNESFFIAADATKRSE